MSSRLEVTRSIYANPPYDPNITYQGPKKTATSSASQETRTTAVIARAAIAFLDHIQTERRQKQKKADEDRFKHVPACDHGPRPFTPPKLLVQTVKDREEADRKRAFPTDLCRSLPACPRLTRT